MYVYPLKMDGPYLRIKKSVHLKYLYIGMSLSGPTIYIYISVKLRDVWVIYSKLTNHKVEELSKWLEYKIVGRKKNSFIYCYKHSSLKETILWWESKVPNNFKHYKKLIVSSSYWL